MSPPDLSPGQRRERGTELCRRLHEDVARIAPGWLGRWDGTWEIVAPASADYMAALTAWEADPGPETVEAVRTAYRAVLTAWRAAAAAYREREARR